MNFFMATSHQVFASSEYVKRWLTQVESEPNEILVRHQQHPGRQQSLGPGQNPPPRVHTVPHKLHNDVPARKSRSNRRRQAPCTENKDDSEDNQEQETFKPFAEDHAPRKPHLQHIALKDRSEKYARRPRHKTKVDRYEYKGDNIRKSPVKITMKRKHKRSKRNKTGDTLNEEFKAPNIEQDRLTLKANVGPGIFGKGRASALLQTCGLPDLTFSEMNFLRKRRLPLRTQLDNSKNATKQKDRSKEISGFFAKAYSSATRPSQTSSEVHRRQYSMDLTDRATSAAIPSPAKLLSNSELSLGTEIPSETGRQSKLPEQVIQHVASNAYRTVEPNDQQQLSIFTQAESTSKQCASAPTHCSWSATPSSHRSKKEPANKPASAEQVPPRSAQHPMASSAYGSPITNSSLDRYTKNVLLEIDHELWQQSHPIPFGSNVVSLDDLKGLAQLAEIEERYSGLPGAGSQQKNVSELCYSSLPYNASFQYHGQSEFTHTRLSSASQLPVGNFAAKPMSEEVFATHDVVPPSPSHLRDIREHWALPWLTAPIGSIRRQTNAYTTQHDAARLEQARPYDSSSNTPDRRLGHYRDYAGNVKQFYYGQQNHTHMPALSSTMPGLDGSALGDRHGRDLHQESAHIYGKNEQKTSTSGIPTLRAAEILSLEEYASENFKAQETLPELYGLIDGENMEDCVGMYDQAVAYDIAQPDFSVGDTFENSLEQHISDDGEEITSAWKQYLVKYPSEETEEEFQGFSRPQILY